MNLTDILDKIFHADCLEFLRQLPDHCLDSVIIDPPAWIDFMGLQFDSSRGGRAQIIAFMTEVMQEALRVVKPGGYCAVWALPRTGHYTAWAIEDAGWIIRDSKIYHIFATGFPKSYNIAKGVEGLLTKGSANWNEWKDLPGERQEGVNVANGLVAMNAASGNRPDVYISSGSFELEPTTEEARRFMGVGTALKVACEEWIIAMAPLSEPSFAANVLKWGTGGMNIDACRVPTPDHTKRPAGAHRNTYRDNSEGRGMETGGHKEGRWPATVVYSHSIFCEPGGACAPGCAVAELDAQSGVRKSGDLLPHHKARKIASNSLSGGRDGSLNGKHGESYGDEGTASRFFHCFDYDPAQVIPFLYTGKATRRERNEGIPQVVEGALFEAYQEGLTGRQTFDKNTSELIRHTNPDTGEVTYIPYEPSSNTNSHPTVKNQGLMRFLVRLLTPPGGTVLDCFAGSGSTLVAAIAEDRHFIGVELNDTPEEPYYSIARARVEHALYKKKKQLVRV